MTATPEQTVWLVIDILDDWLPGTGQAGGTHLDELADRELGLPYLSGKHLKGLLRQGIQCAAHWGHLPQDSADLLFGTQEASAPARLRIENARLPAPVRAHCHAQPTAGAALFRERMATAIDPNTGAAKARSLRAFEVVVPLRLEARVACFDPTAILDWRAWLEQGAALVRAVGKQRNRGFGRAQLTLEERRA
ncbi:RAMP superfamily CRISPR-associated protein [Thiorhodovibrio frisius]|uniref:CRISPR type III-associated protein domain-containing protein n=1 Tax=Thiorhodovibrio frisius TaxID=631362 RepID=H8YVT8_9GAMM|nr:RAMP superfamily CRISPR-associated protein [Thiorhodovibrio frisius]EIC24028.1 hypothetical protein Thi970DRAFT_00169 [Thiorhodovibrio frisius]WPL23102.1 hypothetical protein Thiofri_03284 [Thiorhodovibrio frisius]